MVMTADELGDPTENAVRSPSVVPSMYISQITNRLPN